jgi:hypothetical protein
MIYVIEEHPVKPGTEDKIGVPIGTTTVVYAWEADKFSEVEYSPYGAIGKGLTPNEAIDYLKGRK